MTIAATTVHQFTVTIPANTQTSALYSASLSMPAGVVDGVDIQVPPGSVGLMGFYLAVVNQQVLPFEVGEYFVWDDYEQVFGLTNFPQSGAWTLYGYNLDQANEHSIYLRFFWNPLQAAPASSLPPTVTFTTVVSSPSASAESLPTPEPTPTPTIEYGTIL